MGDFMNIIDRIKENNGYVNGHNQELWQEQLKAKTLCQKYNLSLPTETELREEILKSLLGTYHACGIEPSFHCDYGFNIHLHGFCLLNYNCVILDTSPVNIGDMVFIAPNCVLACSGHAIYPSQRAQGIGTSKPITIEDRVWIGANSTILAGVTIGKDSVIGAGSVVTKDIPSGVIARGVPCKVIRKITEEDIIDPSSIEF